ncbi:acid protease, partial [Thozetella sp. PMI_491]
WYTTIEVGTPPQSLTVLIDTGSLGILIPRNNCTTCSNHNLFDPHKSTTFSPLPGNDTEILFATGGDTIPFVEYQGANCSIVTDTVSLRGLTVPNQRVILCDSYGPALASQPIDGIIGLGPADSLPCAEFGLYYVPGVRDGAELTLGGTDPSKYHGHISTIPLNKNLSVHAEQWVMDIPAIYINGMPVPDSSNENQPRRLSAAIMDTGTSFMMVPDFNYTKDIYALISSDIQPIDEAGTWGAPCQLIDVVARDVTITLGREGALINVTLPKETFNLGEYPGKPGICQAVFVSSIQPSRAPDGTPGWVFGSPLLKYYYTAWNGLALTMGFANATKGVTHCG